MLEAGVEKNQRMEDGLTPLHVASLHGHVQIVDQLLLAQADFDSADDNGATALQYAAQEGAAQLVARLLPLASMLGDILQETYGNTWALKLGYLPSPLLIDGCMMLHAILLLFLRRYETIIYSNHENRRHPLTQQSSLHSWSFHALSLGHLHR